MMDEKEKLKKMGVNSQNIHNQIITNFAPNLALCAYGGNKKKKEKDKIKYKKKKVLDLVWWMKRLFGEDFLFQMIKNSQSKIYSFKKF